MEAEKMKTRSSRKLGEYLLCSPGVIRAALQKQGPTLKKPKENGQLGEILVETGAVSEDELTEAIQHQRVARLQACVLFEELSRSELVAMSQHFRETSVRAGEQFITQDEEDSTLYVIASGRLQVFRVDDDGSEIPLAFVGPGDPIGEMGYFSSGVRTASVRALEAAELLCAEYSDLTHYFENVPRVAHAFVEVVTRRWEETFTRYAEQPDDQPKSPKLQHLTKVPGLNETARLDLGMQQMMEHLIDAAANLTDAERGSLFMVDKLTGELWSMIAQKSEIQEIRLPPGAGIAGWVAQNSEMVNIVDAYEDVRFNPDIDRQTGYRTNTILCAPLRDNRHDLLGVIQVINKKAGAFTEDDEAVLRAFMSQISAAIDTFDHYRRMVKHADTIEVLLKIATGVAAAPDLGNLMSDLTGQITELFECERSEYFVLDYDADELWTYTKGVRRTVRFPVSSLSAGYAASAGAVVNIADVSRDASFDATVDEKLGGGARNLLAVPVFNADNKIIGVIQAVNRRFRSFDDDDETLLVAIAAQVGVAALVNV